MADIITKCPCCGSNIIENSKAYGCENWNSKDNPCDFVIWKTISKKNISKEQAIDICTKGRSLLIEGFVSKAGKPFSAFLVIDDDETKKCKKRVAFEFPERRTED